MQLGTSVVLRELIVERRREVTDRVEPFDDRFWDIPNDGWSLDVGQPVCWRTYLEKVRHDGFKVVEIAIQFPQTCDALSVTAPRWSGLLDPIGERGA